VIPTLQLDGDGLAKLSTTIACTFQGLEYTRNVISETGLQFIESIHWCAKTKKQYAVIKEITGVLYFQLKLKTYMIILMLRVCPGGPDDLQAYRDFMTVEINRF
jgi:hypothetical protein